MTADRVTLVAVRGRPGRHRHRGAPRSALPRPPRPAPPTLPRPCTRHSPHARHVAKERQTRAPSTESTAGSAAVTTACACSASRTVTTAPRSVGNWPSPPSPPSRPAEPVGNRPRWRRRPPRVAACAPVSSSATRSSTARWARWAREMSGSCPMRAEEGLDLPSTNMGTDRLLSRVSLRPFASLAPPSDGTRCRGRPEIPCSQIDPCVWYRLHDAATDRRTVCGAGSGRSAVCADVWRVAVEGRSKEGDGRWRWIQWFRRIAWEHVWMRSTDYNAWVRGGVGVKWCKWCWVGFDRERGLWWTTGVPRGEVWCGDGACAFRGGGGRRRTRA